MAFLWLRDDPPRRRRERRLMLHIRLQPAGVTAEQASGTAGPRSVAGPRPDTIPRPRHSDARNQERP